MAFVPHASLPFQIIVVVLKVSIAYMPSAQQPVRYINVMKQMFQLSVVMERVTTLCNSPISFIMQFVCCLSFCARNIWPQDFEPNVCILHSNWTALDLVRL